MNEYDVTDFLPVSKADMESRGWWWYDFLIVTGDAYVDHPSFGPTVIARVLEAEGFRVAILAQPDWHDAEAFRAMGRPRLGVMICSGNLDSMVAHYTAAKKRRGEDFYSPGKKMGLRPDRAVIVYANRAREAFPDLPIVIGGLEASLRRFAHYDYWDDKVRRSALVDAGADILVYGMGETACIEIARRLKKKQPISSMTDIRGTAVMVGDPSLCAYDSVTVPSIEDVSSSMSDYADATRVEYAEHDPIRGKAILQKQDKRWLLVNPPAMPLSTKELDRVAELPYTRQYHPMYESMGGVPGLEEVKFSVIHNRGCFGGCNFCTIAAHQGKFIQSRSEESILSEVRELARMPEFRGNISDLGAPTANMYGMRGRDASRCELCRRKSCLFPSPCSNMDRDHSRVLALYRKVDAVKGIRHSYIGSGVRYDLFLDEKGFVDASGTEYLRELMLKHTSGRLKVAPEHTEEKVLRYMAKPSFKLFERLRREFDKINRESGTHVELVPYFISSHPGCTLQDMKNLASNPCLKGIWMEQVQDFMPTPMTTSSIMFCTGIDPRNMQEVFVEKNPLRKKEQKSLFFKK